MSPIHVEYSAKINASPEKVYAVIADYAEGHQAILPKPYFTKMEVEHGGNGAGTVIQVWMNVMGVKRIYHMTVSEPEPGRVLAESDPNAGVQTTFTVDPIPNTSQSKVTIATTAKPSRGVQGLLEKLFNPPIMRRIFREELQLLTDYVNG